jgi:hypothetical protein
MIDHHRPAPSGAGQSTVACAMVQVQMFASRGGRRDARRDEPDALRPTIVPNPPGDARFRALIDAFVLSGGRRAEDLEAALRAHYPAAVVRPRALAGERLEVWYVYRDGHWIRTDGDAAP